MVDNTVNKVHISIWKFISVLRFYSNFGHIQAKKRIAKKNATKVRNVSLIALFSSLFFFSFSPAKRPEQQC